MRIAEVPEAHAGDKVAVLPPPFAIPAVAPQNEQAMVRLEEATGLVQR
ncbi:MAG: hypothetical protein Q3997_00445 [Propionibacteriaceae bacterium]|nr:hypothetical protein [Propionibacteriaceae bacterium]